MNQNRVLTQTLLLKPLDRYTLRRTTFRDAVGRTGHSLDRKGLAKLRRSTVASTSVAAAVEFESAGACRAIAALSRRPRPD